jgi:hypothetical protein
MTICWLPVVVSGVTAWPEAAEDVTAGVEPGAAPLLTTKISNDGGAEGAGAHWNAQPMFHVPPAMVNAGLVQLPVCWVSGISTVAGPTAAGVEVAVDPEDPVATVVLVDPAAVVVVVAPAAVVDVAVAAPLASVVEALLGGGSL